MYGIEKMLKLTLEPNKMKNTIDFNNFLIFLKT